MAPHFSLALSRSGQEDGGSCGCTGKCMVSATAMKGRYPEAFVGGNPLDKMGVKAGDMELVKAPLDFFGMNYYQRTIIAAAEPDKKPARRGA